LKHEQKIQVSRPGKGGKEGNQRRERKYHFHKNRSSMPYTQRSEMQAIKARDLHSNLAGREGEKKLRKERTVREYQDRHRGD